MEDFSEEDMELDEEERPKWKTCLGCLWVGAYLFMYVCLFLKYLPFMIG